MNKIHRNKQISEKFYVISIRMSYEVNFFKDSKMNEYRK